MSSPGWPTLALAVVGAAMILAGTGWPDGEWRPLLEDLPLLIAWAFDKAVRADVTGRWTLYAWGCAIALLAFTWLALRELAGAIIAVRYRAPADLWRGAGRS